MTRDNRIFTNSEFFSKCSKGQGFEEKQNLQHRGLSTTCYDLKVDVVGSGPHATQGCCVRSSSGHRPSDHKPHLRRGTRRVHPKFPLSRTGPESNLNSGNTFSGKLCGWVDNQTWFCGSRRTYFNPQVSLQPQDSRDRLGTNVGEKGHARETQQVLRAAPAARKHRKSPAPQVARGDTHPAPRSLPHRVELSTGSRAWRGRPPQRASSPPADLP